MLRQVEDRHWWCRSLHSLALSKIPETGPVLDAGCGTGGMLHLLRDRASTGVDLFQTALFLSRDRGLARLVRGTVCALPFRDGNFSAVLALDLVYHRSVSDDAEAVRECARVLRPGGVLILQAPSYAWLSGSHDRSVHGIRRYTKGKIRRLVTGAGLQIRDLTYRNGFILPLAAVYRFMGRILPSAGSCRPRSDLAPVPPVLNQILYWASRIEDSLLGIMPLPAGLSVWCVADKTS